MTIARQASILERGSVPRYRQIEAILRDQIWSGELTAGDRMPTEEDLSKMFQVSRPTVRQALQVLEQDKLIYREAGRGTFVNAIIEELPTERRLIRLSDLADFEEPAKIEILRDGTLAARGQVRAALNLQFGEELFFFVRIFRAEGQPFGGGKVHVSQAIAKSLTRSDMRAPRFLDRLSERTGIKISHIDFSLDAVLADARTSNYFETHAGAPMISVRRTTFATDGAPVEHSQMLFRSDLCRLSFRRRPKRGGWVTC
jgi:GntR family transcriptional regulator